VQRRKADNEYEEGETMSDQTHLLERIMGLQVELNHLGDSSRQQYIRHDAELSRLQNENRNLQARLHALQAENNTLRVQLEAGLSVISYLEQRLKLHLKFLLEQ
jgi:ABC-type phosphate transport system auxiliary subunit